jgi:hypothetical protein
MPGSAKGDAGGSAVTSTTPNAATRVTPGDSTVSGTGRAVQPASPCTRTSW